MNYEHHQDKSELGRPRNLSLAIKESGLVKRGLELIDTIGRCQLDVRTNVEKEAIDAIIFDCDMHYKIGPNMFASAADFYYFLYVEVRFHAFTLKLDFEKGKKAYIYWAKKYHSSEYDHLS
jgi:hypothetical protein